MSAKLSEYHTGYRGFNRKTLETLDHLVGHVTQVESPHVAKC